jgi:hypothetical protein
VLSTSVKEPTAQLQNAGCEGAILRPSKNIRFKLRLHILLSEDYSIKDVVKEVNPRVEDECEDEDGEENEEDNIPEDWEDELPEDWDDNDGTQVSTEEIVAAVLEEIPHFTKLDQGVTLFGCSSPDPRGCRDWSNVYNHDSMVRSPNFS